VRENPKFDSRASGERRRVWPIEQKREIVAESLGPDLTPSEVARKYGISSGLLYNWRRQFLDEQVALVSRRLPSFTQVQIEPAPQRPQAALVQSVPPRGLIEIVLPSGVTLRVDAAVDAAALRRVLAALDRQ
jgi:transposase